MDDLFDRSKLRLLPLAQRVHELSISSIKKLNPTTHVDARLQAVAEQIFSAVRKEASVVFLMGAHVIRAGVQRYVIDMLERGFLSCIAMNGAGVIHDFELSLIGATTESVARYVAEGQFGLWQETSRINDVVAEAAENQEGLGLALGREIQTGDFPYKNTSLLAAAYRLGTPVTVHVGLGYDIVHEHPNCNGAAYGATSYVDFLRFARVLEKLDHGVVMNFGSAVMGPEVFLKALAMVCNVALQEDRKVSNFTTLVCDLVDLPHDLDHEAPRTDPLYYFRPWKTLLVRTLAGDGRSFYVRGNHAQTIPQLWTALVTAAREPQ